MRNDNVRRIEVLEANPSLGDPFLEEVFGAVTKSNMATLKGAVLGGIASEELLSELKKFVPIVYNINGVLFLHGATEEEYEFGKLTELFNMSEEMATGNSTSIYVDATYYFAYADAGATEQVKNFLHSLK